MWFISKIKFLYKIRNYYMLNNYYSNTRNDADLVKSTGHYFFENNEICDKIYFVNEFGIYNARIIRSNNQINIDDISICFNPISLDKIVKFNIITSLYYVFYIKNSKFRINHNSYKQLVSDFDTNNRENKFDILLND